MTNKDGLGPSGFGRGESEPANRVERLLADAYERGFLDAHGPLTDAALEAGAREIWGMDQASVETPFEKLSGLVIDDLTDTARAVYFAIHNFAKARGEA